MPSNSSAQESYLGYLFQAVLALLILIKKGGQNPNYSISVEKFDDVAFEENGTPKELIQAKHHVKSKGSLSDKSIDLWKSIYNWIKFVKNGDYDFDEVVFSIVTTSVANPGNAAYALKPSKAVRDIDKALNLLKGAAKSSDNEKLKNAFKTFLDLSDEEKQLLLSNIFVLDNSPNIEDTKQEIINHLNILVRAKNIDDVYDRIQGWWFKNIIKNLAGKELSPISYGRLRSVINDIRDEYTKESLPIDFPSPLDVDKSHLSDQEKLLLKQLELISLSEKRIVKAISDYFRAFKQRAKWIRNGNIFEDELDKYEETLKDEWEREFEKMIEELGEEDTKDLLVKKGRELFNTFDSDKVTEPHLFIRPKTSDYFIMRGTMHILSNYFEVGWHPEFKERLVHIYKRTTKEYIS